MGQSERDLFMALMALSFTARESTHFGACGIRTTDHCTTPSKCDQARKAMSQATQNSTGMATMEPSK